MKPGILKIGLTGGIGSGKSIICRMFSILGVPVYDSDRRAKELMASDEEVIKAVTGTFGREAYRNGILNRSFLASRVFKDNAALAKLNAIVHPAVMHDFDRFAEIAEGCGKKYVILESAILFENNLTDGLDCVVTVSAPEELRIARIIARDGYGREAIAARMANQMTDAERECESDFVINNDESALVWEQVFKLDALFNDRAGMSGEALPREI